MAKKDKVDLGKLGTEFMLGQKSLRTIAGEFKISVSTLTKWAEQEGWVQDKTEEIRTRTRAALIIEHKSGQKANTPTREDIEKAVLTNVQVIREHRQSILSGRQIVQLLAGQLNEAAIKRDELEEDIEKETEGDADSAGRPDKRRRNFMLKAISLPSHAAVVRDLSTALKNLIPLERQAFNLDVDNGMKDPIRMTDEEIKAELDSLRGQNG